MKNPWNQSPQNQLPVTSYQLPSEQAESPVTDHCSLITDHCLESVPAEVVKEELTETIELTYEEESDRLLLERKVEQAFWNAGLSLRELKERKLYRSTHKTFEDYLKDRFAMKLSRSYQMIDAAKVVDNLLEKAPPMVEISDNLVEKVPPLVEVLPTSERQVRPLTKLEPEQQREAWTKAVEFAGGKVPSCRIVKDIVQIIKEKTQKAVPNPFHIGDVCRIIASSDPELKGKGGQWSIVSEIHEFSCTVKIYQGEITIALENLRLIVKRSLN